MHDYFCFGDKQKLSKMQHPQLALLVDWLAASAEKTRNTKIHSKVLFPRHFTDVLARQYGKWAFHMCVTPLPNLEGKVKGIVEFHLKSLLLQMYWHIFSLKIKIYALIPKAQKMKTCTILDCPAVLSQMFLLCWGRVTADNKQTVSSAGIKEKFYHSKAQAYYLVCFCTTISILCHCQSQQNCAVDIKGSEFHQS